MLFYEPMPIGCQSNKFIQLLKALILYPQSGLNFHQPPAYAFSLKHVVDSVIEFGQADLG